MDDSTGVTVVDEPSQSVYVANLNMKIKKGAMKKALYALFTAHGRIVSIALQRTEHLLGQAWVTFADIPSAAAAKRQLQGFPLYDRPLRLVYAKERSHVIDKLEGTFKPRPKSNSSDPKPPPRATKRAREVEAAPSIVADAGVSLASSVAAPAATVSHAVPSRTLLVQGLPTTIGPEALTELLRKLFGQFAGLGEVRTVPQRGLAFIEFASELAAIPALQNLHNFKLSADHQITVSFAK